ncbi:MAG: aminotransferase class V-fold PLP-dependent enzyme [Alphaproteobacteria bacterium]|nr:aminotransferase class V-fold PLP-dependent enzyme [Alphaproteobacteria bacterium]
MNHAAVSPLSDPVRAAVDAAMADTAADGVGAFMRWMGQRERLRASLAALIGAGSPADVALTRGTTAGITALAFCLDWAPGDRIIGFDGEFPANVTPWQRAAATFDLTMDLLSLDGFGDGSGRGLERLEAALKQGVRVVAVSAVQFSTGLRMPLAAMSALAHEHGALLAVDGIQACGATPVDVEAEGVDLLACGAHKWMMGAEGCGFGYVAPEHLDALQPRMAGWFSHEDGLRFLFEGEGHLRYDRPIRRRIDFLEGGAWNTVGFAALEAALSLTQSLGVEQVFTHVQGLLDALEAGLVARGFRSLRATDPAARSCILALKPPEGVDVVALHKALGEAGVSCTIPDGCLRFSPHWPNGRGEVPAVLEAVDAALLR